MTAPFSEWLVILHPEVPAPVVIRGLGDTPIGSAAGWSCVASLATDERDGRRVDELTLTCTRGDLEVRTRGMLADGEPPTDYAPLQISEGPERTPVVTVAFCGRAAAA